MSTTNINVITCSTYFIQIIIFRKAINRRIPALRTVNSQLPYVLENVFLGANFFETNGRRWTIRPSWVISSDNTLEHVLDREKCELIITQYNPQKQARQGVNKPCEEVYEKLFDEYIRDGTIVRGSLCFGGIPEFMKTRRANERDLKMRVTNLELERQAALDYDYFIRFIDLDVLENVKFIVSENSVALLDKPEVSE